MTKRIENALKELFDAFKEEQDKLGNTEKFKQRSFLNREQVKLYAYRSVCFMYYPKVEEFGNEPHFILRMYGNDFPTEDINKELYEIEEEQ